MTGLHLPYSLIFFYVRCLHREVVTLAHLGSAHLPASVSHSTPLFLVSPDGNISCGYFVYSRSPSPALGFSSLPPPVVVCVIVFPQHLSNPGDNFLWQHLISSLRATSFSHFRAMCTGAVFGVCELTSVSARAHERRAQQRACAHVLHCDATEGCP